MEFRPYRRIRQLEDELQTTKTDLDMARLANKKMALFNEELHRRLRQVRTASPVVLVKMPSLPGTAARQMARLLEFDGRLGVLTRRDQLLGISRNAEVHVFYGERLRGGLEDQEMQEQILSRFEHATYWESDAVVLRGERTGQDQSDETSWNFSNLGQNLTHKHYPDAAYRHLKGEN